MTSRVLDPGILTSQHWDFSSERGCMVSRLQGGPVSALLPYLPFKATAYGGSGFFSHHLSSTEPSDLLGPCLSLVSLPPAECLLL